MLLAIGCAVILASAKDASANRISLPPSINLAIGDQHELGQASPPVQRETPPLPNMLTS
jgi:hypothetical protein